MSNPKLSRIIHEAAASPIGSTKRDKARPIISILNKTAPKDDFSGQGGPGDFMGPYTPAYATQLQSQSQSKTPPIGPVSTTVFPSVPSFKLPSFSSTGTLAGDLNKLATSTNYTSPTIAKTPDTSKNFNIFGSIWGGLKSLFTPPPQYKQNQLTTKSNISVGDTPNPQLDKINSYLGIKSVTVPGTITPTPQVNNPGGKDKTETIKTNADGTTIKSVKETPVKNRVSPIIPTSNTTKTDTTKKETTPTSTDPYDPNSFTSIKFNKTFTGKGIINTPTGDYDISSYATDPNHEAGVQATYNLMNGVDMTDPSIVQAVIAKLSPKSPITGQMVIDVANKYKVDPALLIAMMQQDSSLGTAGKAVKTMNPGNVGNDDSENGRVFPSWSNGVAAVGDWLSKHIATANGAPTTGATTSSGLTLQDAMGDVSTFTGANSGSEAYANYWAEKLGLDPNQVAQSADLINQKNELDTILAKKTELEAGAPTVKKDMTDYIKSRDTYVNTIDNLIDNVNSTMATQDISNPVTNKMYTDYKNYLLTLRGKQNQRYTDYLNTSIEQYNTDLTNVQTRYQNAATAYNDAIKTGTALSKDKYDETKKILTDFYNENLPEKLASRQKAIDELGGASLDNVNSIVLNGYKQNWLTEQSGYQDKIINKTTGELIDNFNLPGAMQMLGVELKQNPLGVLDLYETGAKTKLSSLSSSKSSSLVTTTLGYINQLDQIINNTKDVSGNPIQTSNLSPDVIAKITPRVNDIKQSLLSTIQGSITKTAGKTTTTGLKGYFVDNYSTFKKVVAKLSGAKETWHDWGSHAVPTKDALIKEFSDLDPSIVSAIYDLDVYHKSSYGDSDTILKQIEAYKEGDPVFAALTPAEQLAEFLTARLVSPNTYNNI